jgi:hypothetical protein
VRARFWAAILGVTLAAGVAPAFASAGLGLLKPDPSLGATSVGHVGYSADGLGQTGTGGTIQADLPAGSTVLHAWLYASYYRTAPTAADLAINFDGTVVTLAKIGSVDLSNYLLTAARADVTAIVSRKVERGGAVTSFVVNSDPTALDGVALVVVYSNPNLPVTTIAVLDGASSTTGDTANFAFAKPIDPTATGFQATMSLGSGHSYQGESGHVCGTQSQQSSLVDVNGKRLTSCAGNFDDGVAADGALITVGGVGDSTDDPTMPKQQPKDGSTPRGTDDELYNIKPFLNAGDTSLTISTSNPPQPGATIGDDLLFLAVISISGEAGVTTQGGVVPPPPTLGKTFNAQVVSGKVTCRAGNAAFKPVTAQTQFKVGTECDATKGAVRITTAAGPAKVKALGAAPKTQSAVFFQGRFKLSQARQTNSYTTLTLSGGDFKKTCAKKTRHVHSLVAADPLVRKLWGKGKGRFRTKGRYSSASVRGTYWNTEDHCNSTVTKVRSGTVVVNDNVKHKKVIVTGGHEYIAKGPSRRQKAVGSARRTWLDRSWLPLQWLTR